MDLCRRKWTVPPIPLTLWDPTTTLEDPFYYNLVVVQWKSYVWLFVTPWTAVHKVSLPLTIFQVLPEIKSIDCMKVHNLFLLSNTCLLLISLFLRIRVFSRESVLCSVGEIQSQFGDSASVPVILMHLQSWFPLCLTGLILQSNGHSQVIRRRAVWRSHICTCLLARPWMWLYVPPLVKSCLHFLTCFLNLWELFFQEVTVFSFYSCSYNWCIL